jgi:SAM-dependent methyltransferase
VTATLGGYNPDHYRELFESEDRHFWFRARNAVLETVVRRETAGLPDGYRVLEIGCGTGYVLRMLKSVCNRGSVVGMDLFLEGLEMARLRSSAALVQGRIEQPPFRHRFDVVGLFDTLEHIQDDRSALAHLHQLIRPGGTLLITVPAWQSLWSDFDEEAHHCRRYEASQLTDRLAEANFQVEYLTPFMAALYPLAWIGRRIMDARRGRQRRRGGVVGSAVTEQVQILAGNDALAWILAQEARLVARGFHLPLGTSLLAVARAR